MFIFLTSFFLQVTTYSATRQKRLKSALPNPQWLSLFSSFGTQAIYLNGGGDVVEEQQRLGRLRIYRSSVIRGYCLCGEGEIGKSSRVLVQCFWSFFFLLLFFFWFFWLILDRFFWLQPTKGVRAWEGGGGGGGLIAYWENPFTLVDKNDRLQIWEHCTFSSPLVGSSRCHVSVLERWDWVSIHFKKKFWSETGFFSDG